MEANAEHMVTKLHGDTQAKHAPAKQQGRKMKPLWTTQWEEKWPISPTAQNDGATQQG